MRSITQVSALCVWCVRLHFFWGGYLTPGSPEGPEWGGALNGRRACLVHPFCNIMHYNSAINILCMIAFY